MEFIKENKKRVFIGASFFIVLLTLLININNISVSKMMIKVKTPGFVENAQDFHITSSTIMIFDGSYLYITDKDGELLRKIDKSQETYVSFFAGNFGFLYDEDLKKLYKYGENGEYLGSITMSLDLYNIEEQGSNIVLHLKEGNNEEISILDGLTLRNVYKTDNYITSAYVINEKRYAISEISPYAQGYKTILTIADGQVKKSDFNQEVGLSLNIKDKRIFFITDKNLYKITPNEITKKDIPNISDVLYRNSHIYLLHSGILSKYNLNLNETDKMIVAANVTRLKDVGGSIYAYGESDIGGEIGTSQEFYTRLGSGIERMEVGGVTVATLKDGKVNIYKIVSSRSVKKNTMRDISGEND